MAHGVLQASRRLLGAACFTTCLVHLLQMECAVLPERVPTGFSVANEGVSESWSGTAAARPFMVSGSGIFALAFVAPSTDARRASEGVFSLSVVSLQSSSSRVPTAEVVWSAGGGKQAVVEKAVVSLGAGGLELREAAGGTVVWVVGDGSTREVAAMRMLDSGNLVLEDESGGVVWESFGHPTHTLLPNQNFTRAMRLTTDTSEGCYSLAMHSDRMVLWSGSAAAGLLPWVYWEEKAMQEQRSIDAAGGPIYARLDPSGYLAMYQNETQRVHFISLRSYNIWNIPRRLKLERNGNLYAYYWDAAAAAGQGRWRVDFQAVLDACKLPSPCGRYGICSDGETCSCPGDPESLPYKPRSLNASGDPALGCEPRARLFCSSGDSVRGHELLELSGIDHVGNQFWLPSNPVSLRNCKQRCLENCSCIAAFFHNETGLCFHHSAQEDLGSLMSVSSREKLGYLKVQTTSSSSPPFVSVSEALSQNAGPTRQSSSNPVAMAAILVVTLLSLTILLALFSEMIWRIHCISKERRQDSLLSKVSFPL